MIQTNKAVQIKILIQKQGTQMPQILQLKIQMASESNNMSEVIAILKQRHSK